jgi:hypothetical protein
MDAAPSANRAASSAIDCLTPNVSREEALDAFRAGPRALYWRWKARGPLQRIAEVYVPFRLYSTAYQIGRVKYARLFAMDSVNGWLDLFEFPRPPSAAERISIVTRNAASAALDEAAAVPLLREKLLRLVFQEGFFKTRQPELVIRPEVLHFHIPYWLGLYGDGRTTVRCRVMDAVRRRMEGAKAIAFFEQWLAA